VLVALSGSLLLLGGHRANHGSGGPVDRMLTELFDRGWDAFVFAPIVWVSFEPRPEVAIGALVALCASYLSSYVRARGAALGYSIEESHVTRGVRYALISAGLLFGWLPLMVWLAAALSVIAAAVRTGQVAREARA
jgi:phosphatidylglycerophosphate synthase